MKTFLILSVGLLAADALLLRQWLQAEHRAGETLSAHAASNAPKAAKPASLPATIQAKDSLAALAANLRQAGLSDQLVRAWMTAEIDERYRAREEALQPAWKKTKFWQQAPPVPLARRLALLDLQREKSRLKDEILGYDPSLPENAPYRFLAPEKQREAKRVTEDYSGLIQAYRTNAGYMPTAEEEQQIKDAEAEKTKTLSEFLTADDQLGLEMRTALLPRQSREFVQAKLVPYDRRTTPVALRLAEKLQFFEPTEDEFREIYQTEKILDPMRGIVLGEPAPTIETALRLREIEPAMIEQLKATFGEARYAEYVRATNPDFQRTGDLAERLALPAETPAKAFALLDSVVTDSNHISDDASMDLAQKRAALRSLVDNTRSQFVSLLGKEGAAAFATVSDRWLTPLEQGKVRTPLSSGDMMTRDVGAPNPFQSR